MAMVLATKKISHTATAFELKFMSFDKLNPHLIGNLIVYIANMTVVMAT